MLKSYALPVVVMVAVIGFSMLAGPDRGLAGALVLWAGPILYVLACAWFTCVAAFDPGPWPVRFLLIWAPLFAPVAWVEWIFVHPDTDADSQGMAVMYSLLMTLPIALISLCATLVLLFYFGLRRFEPSKAEPG